MLLNTMITNALVGGKGGRVEAGPVPGVEGVNWVWVEAGSGMLTFRKQEYLGKGRVDQALSRFFLWVRGVRIVS